MPDLTWTFHITLTPCIFKLDALRVFLVTWPERGFSSCPPCDLYWYIGKSACIIHNGYKVLKSCISTLIISDHCKQQYPKV